MAGRGKNRRKTAASARKSPAKRRGGRSTKGVGTRQSAEHLERQKLYRSEAIVIFTFVASLLFLLSNFGLCGAAGASLKGFQLGLFGVLGYVFPLFLIVSVVYGIANRENGRALFKIPAAVLAALSLGGMIHLFAGEASVGAEDAAALYQSGSGGGLLGGMLSLALKHLLGSAGSFLVLLMLFIFMLVVITERSFVGAVGRRGNQAYRRAQQDLEHYREERRIRAEQRRRDEEVRRAHEAMLRTGKIDFDAIKLSPEAEADRVSPGAHAAFPEMGAALPGAHTASPEMGVVSPGAHAASPEMGVASPGAHAASPETGAASSEAEHPSPSVIRTELSPAFEHALAAASAGVPQESREEQTVPRGDTAAMDDQRDKIPEMPDLSGVMIPHAVFADEDPYLKEAFQRADAILNRNGDEQKPSGGSPVFRWESMDPESEAPIRQKPGESERRNVFSGEAVQKNTEAGKPLMPAEDGAGTEGRECAEDAPQTEGAEPGEKADAFAAPERRGGEVSPDPQNRGTGTAGRRILPGNGESGALTRQPRPGIYHFPPLDLLERGKQIPLTGAENEYRETARKLQDTLHSFGVDVTVTNFSRGPAVTRYELTPAQGVKVGRIVALSDDIKLSLAAADIRIEAPIPGKSAVGIEIPNKENNTVYLRDLLESEGFQGSRGKLAFAVGKDIGGQPVVTDIERMPHLLIAGATGSGKSVCINTLIMSLLYRYRPEDVKLMMIDPKVVELSVYNGIPHLLIPVVTDPKKAAGALNWAVAEMTDRYRKFADSSVRDLKGYNEKILEAGRSGSVSPEELPELLPQIVIVIDELADLMMVSKNEVEEAICRIAQLARAAGMHLVIATQRPSVNVITGLIKANIPSRIAFAVSSGVDSRTILDSVGAEKLLGKGDMLFAPQAEPHPIRVQGAFVSDHEVQKVVEFIKNEELPLSYDQETVAHIVQGGESKAAAAAAERDELFEQAGRFIIEKDKASIGNLQRMFKIGFNRAARIMDQLSEAGVVGEEQGTKPRDIIMTTEQFEALLNQSK